MATFRHLLVPVDFGDAMQPALDFALSIARSNEARITLMHAFDLSAFISSTSMYAVIDTEPIRAGLARDLKALCEATRATWPRVDAVMANDRAPEAILEVAKTQECDLIVIGTHGRRGLTRVLLGSVAEKVVRLSPVPVLTVRPKH